MRRTRPGQGGASKSNKIKIHLHSEVGMMNVDAELSKIPGTLHICSILYKLKGCKCKYICIHTHFICILYILV